MVESKGRSLMMKIMMMFTCLNYNGSEHKKGVSKENNKNSNKNKK